MKVDINSLGIFNKMAREGAESAAASLTQMTGVETFVNVTKINFIPLEDIEKEFGQDEFIGVRIGLEGELDGYNVMVFDRDCAKKIAALMMGGMGGGEDDEGSDGPLSDMERSAVQEIGNIMTSGFIDGWANFLDATIDISTPQLVEGSSPEMFGEDVLRVAEENGHVLVFKSQIQAVDEEVDFRIYMFPEHDSMQDIIDSETADSEDRIDTEKLVVFNAMAKHGADTVSENMTMMTGIDTTVEITRFDFVPLEDLSTQMAEKPRVGTILKFDGLPSGYLMILFDEESGREIAESMMPTAGTDTDEANEFSEMHQSAVQEIGNIMTSGFIDGWANVLGQTIDISTPNFVHDMGNAIMDQIVVRLAQKQQFALAFDTTIEAESREFDCRIYALPDEDDFKQALESLDVDLDEIEEESTAADVDAVLDS